MKKSFKRNSKPFAKTIILSFLCTLIHVFICNYGGIYNFMANQQGNIISVIFDIILSSVMVGLAVSLLLSINIFVTKILILVANFIALIYSYFVVHLGVIINEQIIISALFYGEGNDVSSAFDSWIYLYVLPLFFLTSWLISSLQKKFSLSSEFKLNKIFILHYAQNIITKITYNLIAILLFIF